MVITAQKNFRRNLVLLLATGLALTLSACGGTSTNGEQNIPSATPAAPPTWSLTGELGPEGANLKPVVVIKVENSYDVRPQKGLEKADMVVEELVEGGMTRFAAVYQSEFPKIVGPVRSVRHVDAAISSPIADAFVFSGGAKKTLRFLESKLSPEVTVITEGGPGMYRDSKYYAPHNLFLKTQEVLDSLAVTNTPTAGLFPERTDVPFEMPVETGSSALPSADTSASPSSTSVVPNYKQTAQVRITFSTSEEARWTWDSAAGVWLRSQHSTPFVDFDGNQISTKNVIVLEVPTMDAGYKDPAGGYVPRSVLTSSGKGWILSNGISLAVTWHKEHVADPITFTDIAGNSVAVPTGKMWVELQPKDSGETQLKATAGN